jgi:acyl-coenzyme A synthetase/AMP-(fatty) acid ligase
MPLGFWGDPSGERYHAAYFARFPEVWAHGDFASWTTHGGMVIHGRSDATLHPGGVRIGTAEIYRVVESVPEVLEALASARSTTATRASCCSCAWCPVATEEVTGESAAD